MTVYYTPRYSTVNDIGEDHDRKAAALGLVVNRNGVPKEVRVLIKYEYYTADYNQVREKPYVVYTRRGGLNVFRASYKTLEAAAKTALKLDSLV